MAEESEPQAASDPRARRHRRLFFGSLAVGALLLIAACTPVKPPAGDTTPPAAPTIDLDEASDGGPPHNDNITNDTTPTFVGMAEEGATVRLLDGLTDVGVGAADGAGSYSITSTELAPGSHEMRALAIDAANNQSEPSPLLVVMIDTTPPATAPSAPDLITTDDSGASNTDNVTNVAMPTFEGTGANGLFVRLYSGTQAVGTAAVVGGDYSITSPLPFLDGPHAMTVRHVDAAGNESAPSGTLNVTIDTTAPVVGLDDVADPSPAEPELSGAAGIASGDLNSVTVEIYEGTNTSGDPDEAVTVTPVGESWTATPTMALVDAAVYTVQATQSDVAGNTGTSGSDTFTVDATP